MWIDQYMSTRHVVVMGDGAEFVFCSLACTARHMLKGEHVKKILVADFLTCAPVDATKAHYLEGSDVPGVMSHTSRIAFSEKSSAEEFRKKHGGRIISFKKALRNQHKGN